MVPRIAGRVHLPSGRRIESFAEHNPVLLGAVGLGIGVIIGALLPRDAFHTGMQGMGLGATAPSPRPRKQRSHALASSASGLLRACRSRIAARHGFADVFAAEFRIEAVIGFDGGCFLRELIILDDVAKPP